MEAIAIALDALANPEPKGFFMGTNFGEKVHAVETYASIARQNCHRQALCGTSVQLMSARWNKDETHPNACKRCLKAVQNLSP